MDGWGRVTTAERILGIDEAGRGSLIGPLVVGAFCISSDRLEDLTVLGAKDSKALTPEARERVYDGLARLGTRAHVALAPRTVDSSVVRGKLNVLEVETFARLIRQLDPDVAYVDACDTNQWRFGLRVGRLVGARVRVVARHHADRDYPIVGAASIVAKVRRDRALARLREVLGADLGSGYPSDSKTLKFVREALASRTAPPSWVRCSWTTMQGVKPHRPARTLESFEP